MKYSKSDKVRFIVDIVKGLKTFPAVNGGTIDIYKDEWSYVEKFKEISQKWINGEDVKFNGFLYFEEINKYFEYDFPISDDVEPLFVLRKNMTFKN